MFSRPGSVLRMKFCAVVTFPAQSLSQRGLGALDDHVAEPGVVAADRDRHERRRRGDRRDLGVHQASSSSRRRRRRTSAPCSPAAARAGTGRRRRRAGSRSRACSCACRCRTSSCRRARRSGRRPSRARRGSSANDAREHGATALGARAAAARGMVLDMVSVSSQRAFIAPGDGPPGWTRANLTDRPSQLASAGARSVDEGSRDGA